MSHSESPRRVGSEGAELGWEPVCQSSEGVAPRPHSPPFTLAWLPGFDGEEFVGEKGTAATAFRFLSQPLFWQNEPV